jgi:hypothetical protein
MATPPNVPAFDKSRFPELAGYHGLLELFFKDTAAALRSGLTLRENVAALVRGPLTVKVPDDWRDIAASEMRNSWHLYPSDGSPTAAYRLRVRKELDGMVEVAGLTIPPTPTSLGVAFVWPSGYVPHQEEIFGLQAEGEWVEVRSASTGPNVTRRQGVAAQPQGWVSLSGMRFRATDRTPVAWSAPFPLFFAWEKLPALVLVDAVKVDSNGRAAGVHQTAVAEWQQALQGGKPGFSITRIPGLTPTTSYSVTVWALAG